MAYDNDFSTKLITGIKIKKFDDHTLETGGKIFNEHVGKVWSFTYKVNLTQFWDWHEFVVANLKNLFNVMTI